jgi:hypothetical protein
VWDVIAKVRNILMASGCVAGLLGGGLALASPAVAAPTGCYAFVATNGGYARCDGGTGEVRVLVSCAEDPPSVVRFGLWEGPNLNSIVFCDGVAASYQTRG